jgi:hypothetical protein
MNVLSQLTHNRSSVLIRPPCGHLVDWCRPAHITHMSAPLMRHCRPELSISCPRECWLFSGDLNLNLCTGQCNWLPPRPVCILTCLICATLSGHYVTFVCAGAERVVKPVQTVMNSPRARGISVPNVSAPGTRLCYDRPYYGGVEYVLNLGSVGCEARTIAAFMPIGNNVH